MIELSIIIPTYGRVDKIRNAIDSVIGTNNFEVIVVDDNGLGSKNQIRTEGILREYEKVENFKYFPLEVNSGAGVARNFGIKHSKGKYITFLDDDDFFIDRKLEEKFKFFLGKEKQFDICCSHMRVERDGKKLNVSDDQFLGSDAKQFLLDGTCYTSMIMIKKSEIVRIGGFFDTPYLQDHTLMLKAYLMGCRVCVFEEEVFVHTLHNDSTITTGKRPISGVALRTKLEKELANKLVLTSVESKRLNYRWNTIEYHSKWISNGRSFRLFIYLMNNTVSLSSSKSDIYESIKLIIKFSVNYQYYCR